MPSALRYGSNIVNLNACWVRNPHTTLRLHSGRQPAAGDLFNSVGDGGGGGIGMGVDACVRWACVALRIVWLALLKRCIHI